MQFVQFLKNVSFRQIIDYSPYKALLFDRDPKFGLMTYNLLQEVLKSRRISEENFEEIYSQYKDKVQEQENQLAYCNVCKIESAVEVCDLSKTNKKIQEERKAGHVG